MSRGRKERTPAQLAVLAQAREKAKIVIAERAKINAFQKTLSPEPEPVAVSLKNEADDHLKRCGSGKEHVKRLKEEDGGMLHFDAFIVGGCKLH